MTSTNDCVRIIGRREKRGDGELSAVYTVEGLSLPELHFGISDVHGDLVSSGFDAAAVALLIPAMTRGGRLQVDGPMSPELVWNLNQNVVPLLRRAHPRLKPLSITAERSLDEVGGDAVLTGLSGGVDSLNVCLDFVVDETTPQYFRVTHFVFNDISEEPSRELLSARATRVEALANELDRPLVRVRSNMRDFYELGFQATHSICNSSVAHFLQAGVGTWLYASGFPLSEVHVGTTDDLASLDPFLFPALSTSRVSLQSVGGLLSRVDKTQRLAEWELAHRLLTVCVRSVPNCGTCNKCLRTLLTLEALGALANFEQAFDLSAYRRARGRYIVDVMASDNFLLREIAQLLDKVGFERPFVSRANAAIKSAARRLVLNPVKRSYKVRGLVRWLIQTKVAGKVLRRALRRWPSLR